MRLHLQEGHSRVKRLPASTVLLMVLASTSVAFSQTPLYKSTMPDGSVSYAEKPAAGAARVDKIEPPPPQTGISSLTPQEKARAEQSVKQRAAEAAHSAQSAQSAKSVDDARKQLQQAEAARAAGKDPLPTERIGIAGGGTRLNEAYFARQKSLEDAVTAARKRVDDMQKGGR